MRRKKQQKTNISNLICHIEIPVSATQRWWCNNAVWWWSEFGYCGWRMEEIVLVGDDAKRRWWCDNAVFVRWVEDIIKIQNEGKILLKIVEIFSTISICWDGVRERKRGFWNSKSWKKRENWQKWPSIGLMTQFS